MDSERKPSLIQYVILCVCIFNLVLILFLFSRVETQLSHASNPNKPPLPTGLESKTDRIALFDKIKVPYNAEDREALYALFDDTVKIQLPKDKTFKTLQELYGFTGQIKRGTYSSYEVQICQDGTKNYVLTYLIDTDKGKATMPVTVSQQGNDSYRFLGFRINVNIQ